MMKIHSIFHSISNKKAKHNIRKLGLHLRKKEQDVFVKKQNALKCTVSASLQENFVLLNAPAMAVIIMNNANL